MSQLVKLVVDIGEERSGIPERLRKQGCVVETESLAAGDYLLSAAFAVERKAARDLVDSLLNRRLYEQLERLSSTYEAGALLIEGDSWRGDLRLPRPMLAELYHWLSFSKNLNVHYSPDEAHTATFLAEFATREQLGRAVGIPVTPTIVRAAKTPKDILLALPGVGPTNAAKLLERFGTVHGVATATLDELVRAIGATRGRHLFDLLRAAGT